MVETDESKSGKKLWRKSTWRSSTLSPKAFDVIVLGDFCKPFYLKKLKISPFTWPGTKKTTNAPEAPASEPEGAQPKQESDSGSDSDDGKHEAKILKQLQFPEIESGSFSAETIPKIIKSLQERMEKLEGTQTTFAEISSLTAVQSQH